MAIFAVDKQVFMAEDIDIRGRGGRPDGVENEIGRAHV